MLEQFFCLDEDNQIYKIYRSPALMIAIDPIDEQYCAVTFDNDEEHVIKMNENELFLLNKGFDVKSKYN